MTPKKHHSHTAGAKSRRFQRDLATDRQTYEFDVGAEDGGSRLDAFLNRKITWRSRSEVRETIAAAKVLVEPAKDEKGRLLPTPRPAQRLRVGQRVLVVLSSDDLPHEDPDRADREDDDSFGKSPLQVLYDDEHLVAVAKPEATSLYPTRRHGGRSLVELVHADQRLRRAGSAPPSPCHRLDRDTTGVVVFARTLAARAEIGRQFEERAVEKTYLARVRGQLTGSGVIDASLGPDDTSPVELKQAVREGTDGKPASTAWRAQETGESTTLVELRPSTGRQHQLRVHLASIGHPILGDVLYLGGDEMFLRSLEEPLTERDFALLGSETLQLHAWKLGFEHPSTGEWLEIEAPSPFEGDSLSPCSVPRTTRASPGGGR